MRGTTGWAPPTPDEELTEWRERDLRGARLEVFPSRAWRGEWRWRVCPPYPALLPAGYGAEPTREAAMAAAEAFTNLRYPEEA